MQNKKIALSESISLIVLILIASFKDEIFINFPLGSLFKYGAAEAQLYLKLAFFSLCITSIVEYFFIKNSTTTFFSAKCAGSLGMILVIIFGFYFKKKYLEVNYSYINFLIYCFACIVCQVTNYVVMINKKFDKTFRVLHALMIFMTMNVVSISSIKLLERMNLIDITEIYLFEKVVIYIIGITIMEVIAYIIFVLKENTGYFEKIGAGCMIGCSILIFIL